MDYVLLYTSDPSDPPPLWPICIGHENNRSHSAYNWDNSVRKLDFPTRTVQYTISGKGAFTDSMGKEHTVGADDILFPLFTACGFGFLGGIVHFLPRGTGVPTL